MLETEETAASEVPVETKCCRRCGGVYDIAAFRRRRRDSEKRVAVCKFCRRVIDQARYKKGRDGAEQQAALQALTYLESNRSLTRRLAFLDSAIDKFGGPVEFADALHEVYESTNDRRIKFKCLKAILDVAVAPKKQTSF
ncbi:MAG: hypothetical protein ACI814_005160 [Mariniblastus sp.]|jgi:hypothetical protein